MSTSVNALMHSVLNVKELVGAFSVMVKSSRTFVLGSSGHQPGPDGLYLRYQILKPATFSRSTKCEKLIIHDLFLCEVNNCRQPRDITFKETFVPGEFETVLKYLSKGFK